MRLTAVAALVKHPTGLCLGDADKHLTWRVRGDFQHLRAVTQNRVCVVGRKTFEILPDTFKVRTSLSPDFLVLSRSILGYIHKGSVIQARTQAHALGVLRSGRFGKAKDVIVLGGAQVYREWWPICSRAIITLIHKCPTDITSAVHWMDEGNVDLAPGMFLVNEQKIAAQDGDTSTATILTFERHPGFHVKAQALGA